MENKKPEISQEVFDLYDDYAHKRIDRRNFMDRMSFFAVGGLTLPALLDYVMPDYSKLQVLTDDPRLDISTITYNSPKGGGDIKGQLCFPENMTGKLPGIVVVHENRGLNPHTADVGRRAALEGFVSLSPDMLSPMGGYPGTDDAGREMQSKRNRDEMLEDFIAAFDYLKSHPKCTGNIGVVGFCFGGWISNMMAVRVPGLKAAVPFYGGQPAAEDVPKISAPLQIHYGELDKRVNEGWPAYEEALKANNKKYEMHMYANANHGFLNDTTPRYDEASAKLAWSRTIEFFKNKL